MQQVTAKQIFNRWDELSEVLRDAMTTPNIVDQTDYIGSQFHLSEQKIHILDRLVRRVFLGFVHSEDIHKIIKEWLGIDGRLALDIYQELEKKVFAPFKKDIEQNYLSHHVGVVSEEVVEKQKPTEQKVILREGAGGVVNLKLGLSPDLSPIKIVDAKKEDKSTFSPQLKDVSQKPKVASASGPLIIHQKETPLSATQNTSGGEFKQMSYGGFMGSFKSLSQNKSSSVPTAKASVEIPSPPMASTPKEKEEKIPVSVKQYEEKPKTVHYSAFSTPLYPKKEEKDDKEDKVIDLSDMMFK